MAISGRSFASADINRRGCLHGSRTREQQGRSQDGRLGDDSATRVTTSLRGGTADRIRTPAATQCASNTWTRFGYSISLSRAISLPICERAHFTAWLAATRLTENTCSYRRAATNASSHNPRRCTSHANAQDCVPQHSKGTGRWILNMARRHHQSTQQG